MIIEEDVPAMLRKLTGKIAEIQADLKVLRLSPAQRLQKKYLDSQEVCKILKMSERTLAKMRKEGSLPYSKLRRKLIYQASDVDRLLERKIPP